MDPVMPPRQPFALPSLVALALVAVLYGFANAAAGLRLQRYFMAANAGPYLTLALLALVGVAWIVLWRAGASRALWGERTFLCMAIAAWLTACVAMVLYYPAFDACATTYAGGNDRDDALDGATRSLLALQHPYTTAYTKPACGIHVGPGGNPYSPMPGALVMAAPFMLLFGAGAWQNVVWSLAWILVARHVLGSWRMAAGLVLLTILSPQVFASEFVTGGDLFTYTLQALVMSYLVWRVRSPGWLSNFVLPAALGVALSTRPHMLVVLAMLFVLLRHSEGTRRAFVKSGAALVGWAAVTLPFLLADPTTFDPMHAGRWVDALNVILPHARWWLVAILGTLLLAFALKGLRDFESFCVAAGVVLFAAALYLTVMESLVHGRAELLRFSWYGLTGWTFVALGLWGRAAAPLSSRTPPPRSAPSSPPASPGSRSPR